MARSKQPRKARKAITPFPAHRARRAVPKPRKPRQVFPKGVV
jgi:hypothetical protein